MKSFALPARFLVVPIQLKKTSFPIVMRVGVMNPEFHQYDITFKDTVLNLV